jgi:hypothetical protein
MHIYVSSLLKCKMHLHDFVGGHLYYSIVEFEVQIYICIAVFQITLHRHKCTIEQETKHTNLSPACLLSQPITGLRNNNGNCTILLSCLYCSRH